MDFHDTYAGECLECFICPREYICVLSEINFYTMI